MSSGNHISLLEEVGLTTNEASVYLFLLDKIEGVPIGEVVKYCEISSPDVNTALVTLLDKGFVKIKENNAVAVPPEVSLFAALETMEKSLGDRFETARKAVTTLQRPLQTLYWEKRAGIRPEELLESLEDLESMEQRTAQMISEAKENIFILTETFGWYGSIRKHILSAMERGVKAKVLIIAPEEASIIRARELEQIGVEVRQYTGEWYPVRGTLVDEKTLVMLIWATRKDIERPISFRPHYTQNPGLISVFTDSFQTKWSKGKLLSSVT